ncbi:MAG: NADH-quinone oxidoreductase subunit C, partial [Bryobacteraceae bacterium]
MSIHKPPAGKPSGPMESTPWESDLTRGLVSQFGSQILELSTVRGQNFMAAQPDAVIPILEYLKLEADFDYLVDVTAVDYPARAARFDLVYILYSYARNERMRVKTRIAD